MSSVEIPDDAYSAPLANVLDALQGEAGWRVAVSRGASLEPDWRVYVEVGDHGLGRELAVLLGAQRRDNQGARGALWSGRHVDSEARETHVIITAPEPKAAAALRRVAADLADMADQAGQHQVAEHAREAVRAIEGVRS